MVAALALATVTGGMAFAQSGTETVDGVVAGVMTSSSGELESFKLLDASGNVREFRVQGGADATEYGLENQAGDRWVATQAGEPIEAARRLRDHQERFAAVTVTVRDGVALNVVEKESGRLETNLGYLFAVYTITWLAFFAYVFILSRRQRDLQREIVRLKSAADGPGGEKS
jgi:CcmD family protein